MKCGAQPAQRLSQRLLHLGAASSVHTLQEGCHADWLLMHTFSLTSSHSLPSLNLGPGTELRLSLRGDVTVEKADRGYEKPERRGGSDFRNLPSQKQKICTNSWKENTCTKWVFMSISGEYNPTYKSQRLFPHSIASALNTKCVLVCVWMNPLLVTRCLSAAAAGEAATLTLHLSHKHYK